MDLNYLFLRHQTSLMRADSAGCTASRTAHVGLARGYAHRIDAIQRRSGASFPLIAKASDGGARRVIELTGQDGHKIGINEAAIWHIRKGSGDQTAVYAVSGAAIFVLEPYADVLALCRGGAAHASVEGGS